MKILRTSLLSALALACFANLAQAQAAPPGAVDKEVVSRDSRGVPTFVRGKLGSLGRGNRQAAAIQFLHEMTGHTFAGAGSEEFVVTWTGEDFLGQVHIKATQRLRGLPVVGGVLVVHADAVTGEVHLVNGRFLPDRDLPRSPTIEGNAAVESAVREAGLASWEILEKPRLTYVIAADDAAYLAWAAVVRHTGEEGIERDRIFVDATSGALVDRHPQIHRARNRMTYTANYSATLPGTLLITEGGSSTDPVAQSAHNNAGTFYNYYSTRFGRDSVDNAGMTLVSSVHFLPSSGPNNAFWIGGQMACGDGDGLLFSPLCNALDVVVHEFTHGVTEKTTNLTYRDESGALNEAMSDIFGAAAEAWARGISTNTWRIGEEVYTPGTAGDAIRYMSHPTADGASRDYYPARYVGPDDGGGVHWNSGIANLAFYLLVQGGQHPRGITPQVVPAIGLSKAEQIFYRVQAAQFLTTEARFEDLRIATAQAARELYGPFEEAAVHTAWCAVGVPGCPGSEGDLNGDGHADLVWRNSSTGDNAVWFMNGTTLVGTALLPAVADANWRLEAVADFDSDQNRDIFWRNYATGANAIWLMQGTTFLNSVSLPADLDLSWTVAGAADFSGDGSPDLVWRHKTTGNNRVWVLGAPGMVSRTMTLPNLTDPTWKIGTVGDFSGDGRPDLVWHNTTSGAVAIWTMRGATYQTSYTLGTGLAPWYLAGRADYNADGRLDLVWRNGDTGENAYWYLGLPAGTVIGTPLFAANADLEWRIVGPR